MLLQLLDEGHLTDGQGRKVDFSNCLVVLTSNLGAQHIATAANAGLGLTDTTKDAVIGEVQRYLPPEFVNRLDVTDHCQISRRHPAGYPTCVGPPCID